MPSRLPTREASSELLVGTGSDLRRLRRSVGGGGGRGATPRAVQCWNGVWPTDVRSNAAQKSRPRREDLRLDGKVPWKHEMIVKAVPQGAEGDDVRADAVASLEV